jgi:hypothetical protein
MTVQYQNIDQVASLRSVSSHSLQAILAAFPSNVGIVNARNP